MMTFPTISAGTRANEAIGGYANFVAYCNALAAGVDSVTTTAAGAALKANNLSDIASAQTARQNLGLGTMATATATDYLTKAGNLAGLADLPTARTNLGLGTAAVADTGTTAGTVAAGDDSRLTDARTPTAHAGSHAVGGSDLITPESIAAQWSVTKSGRWLSSTGTLSSQSLTNGFMYGALFPVTRAVTFDRIGAYITASGTSGALVRFGIYKADDNGADYTLVLDAGTIDGTQAPGAYAITISQALTPGLYWMVASGQGAPATPTKIYCALAGAQLPHLLSDVNQTNLINNGTGLYAGASGALPASITPLKSGLSASVNVRVA